MIEPEANPPLPPPPSTKTTVIRGDQEVKSVTFVTEDDGRWFRLLNSLIDSGVWGQLSRPEKSVLPVIARHRRDSDGTSLPSLEVLMEHAGESRASVYRATAKLLERGLIEKTTHGAWIVFPGRPFAGRGKRPSDLTPETPRWRPSRPGDDPSHPRDKPSQAGDSRFRDLDRDVGDTAAPTDQAGGDGGGDLVELVSRAQKQLSRDEVLAMLRRHPAQAIRDAIDNALLDRSRNNIRKDFRRHCWNTLKHGYGLFGELRRRREQEQMDAMATRLHALVQPLMTPEHLGLFSAAWLPRNCPQLNPGHLVRAGAVSEAELAMGGQDVLELLIGRAERVLAERDRTPAGRAP